MNKIRIHDQTFVKYIDSSTIYEAIKHIAEKIENDYKNDIPYCEERSSPRNKKTMQWQIWIICDALALRAAGASFFA